MRECGLPEDVLVDRDRRRQHRRGAGRRGRHGHVHRLHAHRQEDHGARGADAHAGLARARRQGPDDRARRRRPRARRRAPPPTTRCRTAARPASRSSACTSRRRSTTRSSTRSPRKVAALRQGASSGPGHRRRRRRHVRARSSTSSAATSSRRARPARGCSPAARPARTAGRFYEPTVLVDVDHSMACMTEETFGPTAADHEGRATPTRRCGSPTTPSTASRRRSGRRTPRAARQIARRVEAGAVCVNDAQLNYLALELPMGGWKASGPGLAPRRGRDPQVLPPAVAARHALRAAQGRPAVLSVPPGPDEADRQGR